MFSFIKASTLSLAASAALRRARLYALVKKEGIVIATSLILPSAAFSANCLANSSSMPKPSSTLKL